MTFCQLCEGLTIAKLWPPNIYYHAKSVDDLEESAKNCEICALLDECVYSGMGRPPVKPLSQLEGVTNEIFLDKRSIKLQIMTESSPGAYLRSEDPNGFTVVGIWIDTVDMYSLVCLTVEEGIPTRCFGMLGHLLTHSAESILASNAIVSADQNYHISGRVFTTRNPAPALLNVLQHWLDRCEREHAYCRDDPPGTPILPDRVIYIPQQDCNIHLQAGLGRRAHYATLSYCWGGDHAITTTTENLQLHMASLSLSDLPKTFKDAISVCRRLGISYLWIDSLCIIQNSKVDWETQSAVMDSIYYNSTITIAAVAASNPSQGLFIPTALWLDDIPLPLTFADNKDQVYLRRFVTHRLPRLNFLRRRAWCYQERALSRRVMYFSKGELEWTCLECFWSQNAPTKDIGLPRPVRNLLELLEKTFERPYKLSYKSASGGGEVRAGPRTDIERSHDSSAIVPLDSLNDEASVLVDFRRSSINDALTAKRITRTTDMALYDFLGDCVRHSIYKFWYSTVEDYAACRLTYAADKLPALTGIASRIHAITKDDYLAGHWRRELPRSLFWSTSSQYNQPRRPVPYRAPSWSWASVDSSLIYWHYADMLSDPNEAAPIQILAAEVEVDGQNQFGRVLTGSVTMKAHVIFASWNKSTTAWVTPCPSSPVQMTGFERNFAVHGVDGTELIGYWNYDDEINALWPGECLTSESSKEEVLASKVPSSFWWSEEETKSQNADFHEEGADDWTMLWRRGTQVPSEVLLIKGIYAKHRDWQVDKYGTQGRYTVLVLARVDQEPSNTDPTKTPVAAASQDDAQFRQVEDGEVDRDGTAEGPVRYRRVGHGQVWGWDDKVERIETLTII
jgi:hypothetical protein